MIQYRKKTKATYMKNKKGQPHSGPRKRSAKLEKLDSNAVIQGEKTKAQHGGAREGAGRKPVEENDKAKSFMDFMAGHADEEVTVNVKQLDGSLVSMTAKRKEILAGVLFEMAVKDKNTKAADLYINRGFGRPINPVKLEGSLTIPQMHPDEDEEQEALEAAIQAYEKKISR